MFQGIIVPQSETASFREILATTPENDVYTSNTASSDIEMEEESIQIIEPEPEPPKQNYLYGSSSFVSRLPRIQRSSTAETDTERLLRIARREVVKEGFRHAWRGYNMYAMGHDELKPVSNRSHDPFGGWGATIADALSTMLIMELHEEFEIAVDTISKTNFFTSSNKHISTFETIIRYLGGFLSAYELSGDQRLLRKAEEVGQVVIGAFDTKYGLPYHRWNIERKSSFNTWISFAEVASVQMEFTTLSRHTGDPIYANKAQQITDYIENVGKEQGLHIKGLYPYAMDIGTGRFTTSMSSFGAMGDSAFEYFLKQYLLVDGQLDQYSRMYKQSITGMKKHMVRQTDKANLLFLHPFDTKSNVTSSSMDHLTCFVPGMLAIGSRVFDDPEDLMVAEGLLETCVHMYRTSNTGLSPETWTFHDSRAWNPQTYNRTAFWNQKEEELVHRKELDDAITDIGATVNKHVSALLEQVVNSLNQQRTSHRLKSIYVTDASYLLRPETIESLFVLYRITGDHKYQQYGWDIWQSIETYCRTPSAYTAIRNVNFDSKNMDKRGYSAIHMDQMESFFFAETLKYLYLLFSPDDVISLDKYVFNTEAHPFLRRSSDFDTQVLDLNVGRNKPSVPL
ncbi:hypothetical protein Unana1_03498 [Umbelopsis nana]